MVESLKDEAFAGQYGQTVQQFHRFLHLQPGDNRRDGWRGGHFAFGITLKRQQIAGHALVEDGPISLAQGAFIAGRLARKKKPSHAVDAFDSAVDPRLVHLPTGAIDPQPGFAIVQAGQHYVSPGEQAESQAVHHVGGNGMDLCFRKNVSDCISSHVSFAPSYVGGAIKNAAGEVRSVDGIKIDDDNVGKAEKRQVLENLIAQRASADHQHARRAQLFLVPPSDKTKPAETVLVHADIPTNIPADGANGRAGRRFQGLAHRAPAVISGCRRRISPSFTAASASVCESWTWRPEF